MNDRNLMEVDFVKYCETCKHADLSSYKDPCHECLAYPCNESSCKPVMWEEK